MNLQVDALYFQARENGVAYAIVDERVIHPSFDPHFGVRAKVGSDVGCDDWKLWLQFLHFHSRERDKKCGEILPTWGFPGSYLGGFADEVDSLWRLHLGILDASLGRDWLISNCFSLLPYFGLRYAEVRHKLEIDYRGGENFSLSMKDKSFGIGPQIGTELLFDLFYGFSIYSRLSTSLLLSKLYVHENQKEKINVLKRDTQGLPLFEGALGIEFCYCRFFSRIAGELYLFANRSQLFNYVDRSMPVKITTNRENLSLHGLSFGLGFNF